MRPPCSTTRRCSRGDGDQPPDYRAGAGLNSPTVSDAVQVSSSDPQVPVAAMLKRHEGASYLFAVAMRSGDTTATFTLKGLAGEKPVEVLGEDRSVRARGGAFSDAFQPLGSPLLPDQVGRWA